MAELWKANLGGWIDLLTITAKELAATKKGKPIRGNYRALPLNQPYGYHEAYEDAVADMLARLKESIQQNESHLQSWVMNTANAKQKYYEAIETYG